MNDVSLTIKASHADVIVCHGCDQVFDNVPCEAGQQLNCTRCGETLRVSHTNWLARTAAFTLSGLILFALALSFPFIGLETAGQTQSARLLSGVLALLERDYFVLASLVFITTFLLPLIELLALSYVVGARYLNIKAPGLASVLHLLFITRPWNMMEIFFIGVLITTIKLGDIASLIPGVGLFAFAGLLVVLIYSHLHLDREALWQWLRYENLYRGSEADELVVCHSCDARVDRSLLAVNDRCPRCHCIVRPRLPDSYQRTLALLIAAVILYFPANLLPIMTTVQLGAASSDTILSGVIHLYASGNIGIAMVVFVASILVPVVKIMAISYLLWAVRRGKQGNPRHQARLYRITEFVGRWSMIDVFVVTLLVALVQFGVLANIEPGGAVLCFAGVVVLTMLAAETFDPRLLWDAHNEQ
ncbi:MAG: paraquat-inducible protein A [Pontibacterium sp.]